MSTPAPRFLITVLPTGAVGGPLSIQIIANASDVLHSEAAAVLCRAAAELLRNASARLKTVAEVEQEQAANANPARAGFVRKVDGVTEEVWLSPAGMTVVQQGLEQCGFRHFIDLPDDVRRPCDYLRDPAAVVARYLPLLAAEDPEDPDEGATPE